MDKHIALLVKMAEKFLPDLLPHGLLDQMAPTLERAEQVLGGEDELGAWPDKVGQVPWSHPLGGLLVCPRVMEGVKRCLEKGEQFTAIYQAAHDLKHPRPPISHGVSPLGLVFRDNIAYLVCFLDGGEKVFQLRLDRIQKITPLAQAVVTPKDFSLDRYIENGGFKYYLDDKGAICSPWDASTREISIRLRLSGHALTYFSEIQGYREKIGETGPQTLWIKEVDSIQLRNTLKGFGRDIEILEPQCMREEFHGNEIRDFLTGLYNRKELDLRLDEWESHPFHPGDTTAVIFIDVDDFGVINKVYDHGVGDAALKAFASAIKENIRKEDLAYRYGGDEFVIIMPRVDWNTAKDRAGEILGGIRRAKIFTDSQEEIKLTASMGLTISSNTPPKCSVDIADGCAKEAKAGGKNQIVCSREGESAPAK